MGNVLNGKNDQQKPEQQQQDDKRLPKGGKNQVTVLEECYLRSFQGGEHVEQRKQNLTINQSLNISLTQQLNDDSQNPGQCSLDTYVSCQSLDNQQQTPISNKQHPQQQREKTGCSIGFNSCTPYRRTDDIENINNNTINNKTRTPDSGASSSYKCIYELLNSNLWGCSQKKKRPSDYHLQDEQDNAQNAYEFWTPPSRKSARRENARQTLYLPKDTVQDINNDDELVSFDEWTPQPNNCSFFQSGSVQAHNQELMLARDSSTQVLPFYDGQPMPISRRISFGDSEVGQEVDDWTPQTPPKIQNPQRQPLFGDSGAAHYTQFDQNTSEVDIANSLDARYDWEWDWDFFNDINEEATNVRSLQNLLDDLDQIAFTQVPDMQQPLLQPPPSPIAADQVQDDPNAQQQVKRKKKKRRRAKVLQEGHLSMVIYGHDERLMWSERVTQFINKISTALGNREYKKWGGSVIDSIVGAFLTQNVADRLSSQTYLNLVAHYPSKISNSIDMADWDKVARIPCTELANILKGRGMNNVLAARIQTFLRRIRGITTLEKGREALEARKMELTPQQRNRMQLHLKGINDTWSQRVVRYKRNNSLIPEIHLDQIGLNILQALPPVPEGGATSDSIEEQTNQQGNFRRRQLSIRPWGAKQLRSGNQRFRYPRNYQVIRRYLSDIFDELGLQNVKEGDKVMCKIENTATEFYQVLVSRIKQGRAKVFFPRTPKFLEVEMWIRGDSPRFWRGTWDDTYWQYLGGYAWRPMRLNVGHEVTSLNTDNMTYFPENDSDVEEDEYEQLLQIQESCHLDITYDYMQVEDIENLGMQDRGLCLEWLKEAQEDEAREFLLQIAGLGRKSVACVMLLALGMKDFPVDVNVGRICTRIGWVPLQVDKEGEQVDIFAPEPQVHRYLYHRLMEFDWSTLYKLHYLMITMGKTLCTRQNPNCLACPMYSQCEYAQHQHPTNQNSQQNNTQQKQHEAPPFQMPIPLLLDADGFVDQSLFNDNQVQIEQEEEVRPSFYSEKVDEIMNIVIQYQQLEKQDKEKYRWKHAITLMGMLDEQQQSSFEKTEIRKKYIQLAKIVHPDKCMDSRAKEAFSAIGWAYQFLKGTIQPPPSEIQNLPESALTYPRNLKVFQGYKIFMKDIQQRLYNDYQIEYAILVEQSVLNVGHRMSSAFCLLFPWSVCTREKFPLDGTFFQPNELFLDERSLRFPILQENLRINLKDAESLNVVFGVTINSICRGMSSRVVSNLFQNDLVCIRSFNLISRLPSWLPVQLTK